MDFVKEWGLIAGVAGLALGVFLVLFREVIRKSIFPLLTKKQGFIIIITFMILVWSVAIFSLWIYFQQPYKPIEESSFYSADNYIAFLAGYESSSALANDIQSKSYTVEKSRVEQWLEHLGLKGNSFPESPALNGAENMTEFLRYTQGALSAKKRSLEASFLLGFYGVVCENTPQVCPKTFNFNGMLQESKLIEDGYTGNQDLLAKFMGDMKTYAYQQIQENSSITKNSS